MIKKIFLFAILLIPINVYAIDATDISKNVNISVNGTNTNKLNDGNVKTSINLTSDDTLTIKSEENNINQLYIVYEITSQTGVIQTSNETTSRIGGNGFLHEYVNLTNNNNSIDIKYDDKVTISEIRIFTEGDTPSDIQKWTKESSADILIFSTHADDEQLFFAGVMPTYINKGKKVHVVYLARHDVGAYYAPSRLHEQLDGLWALGVTDYPTFGLIPDAYSESIDVARSQAKAAGFTDEDIIKFDVEQIREYKPKIILGHDENGEYGHGQHILNIYTLKIAVEKAADSEYIIDNQDAYTVPKFYIHLYDLENATILDYDTPLENFNNKTAYEVSKEGYSKHLSQQYTWFTKWLNGNNNEYTKATEITTYNPAYWGLYKSEVGPDVNKNDLFENISEVDDTSEEIYAEDKEFANTNHKYSLDSLYNKYKDSVIIISGLVVIIGMILIVVIKKNELK